jgi:hypothetical protein
VCVCVCVCVCQCDDGQLVVSLTWSIQFRVPLRSAERRRALAAATVHRHQRLQPRLARSLWWSG